MNSVHISSFDFDGCIYHEDLSVHKGLLKAFIEQNKLFKVNIGMIGSNRQDKKINSSQTEKASAFLILPKFIEALKMRFDPVLLADINAKQAHGTALKTVLEEVNPDTHHADFVFDEKKLSLIYFQAHQAAINACSCEFIILDEEPNNILDLNKRSNAAFVYLKNSNQLIYINTMEEKKVVVFINEAIRAKLTELEEIYNALDVCQKRSCFERRDIFGFRLKDEDLEVLGAHINTTYPIYFDFYDDRVDILKKLNTFFSENPSLLPYNVLLRLHHYDVNNPFTRNYLLGLDVKKIKGEGKINFEPKQEVLERIIKEEILKDQRTDEKCPEHNLQDSLITDCLLPNRKLMGGLIEYEQSLEPWSFGNSRYSIFQPLYTFISNLYNQMVTWFSWRSQYPIWEQKQAIKKLKRLLNNPSSPSLNQSELAVVQYGKLGEIVKKSGFILNIEPKDKLSVDAVLETYKSKRQQRNVKDYTHFFGSYSKKAKFEVVKKLLKANKHTYGDLKNIEMKPDYQKILAQGQLAKTLKKNNIRISFVNDDAQILACISESSKAHLYREINRSTDHETKISQLIFILALSSVSALGTGKKFGDTASFHRFCHLLLTPNSFSHKFRDQVFTLAGLDDDQRTQMHKLSLKPIQYFGESERTKNSETLRKQLIAQIGTIYEKTNLHFGDCSPQDIENLNQKAGHYYYLR